MTTKESDKRCRMTTHDGKQCTRPPAPGGLGFCWQHVPVKDKADREKWKLPIEGAALVVATADLLLKVAEFAVEHCHEFFGEGDAQTRAKHQIEKELDLGPVFPSFPTEYDPGSRVDWKRLLELSREAKALTKHPGDSEAERLEQKFDAWFASLSNMHRKELLGAIEGEAE
jgi:hypothetical protein